MVFSNLCVASLTKHYIMTWCHMVHLKISISCGLCLRKGRIQEKKLEQRFFWHEKLNGQIAEEGRKVFCNPHVLLVREHEDCALLHVCFLFEVQDHWMAGFKHHLMYMNLSHPENWMSGPWNWTACNVGTQEGNNIVNRWHLAVLTLENVTNCGHVNVGSSMQKI